MSLSTFGRSALLLSLFTLPGGLRATASEPPARSLEFIENKGQWDARARYVAPLPAGRMFLEAGGFTYSFLDPQQLAAHHRHGEDKAVPVADELRAHAYTMRFVDCRAGVTLQPREATGEVRNYLLGNDEKRWARGVAGYRQLRYQGLWSGIDARLYENRQGQLEYDFELAAKADPDRIRLRYDGADALKLRADGALEISTSVGTVTELAPQAWQLDAKGQRQPVSCHYVLQGKEVRFELGKYDAKRPLVIDPTVVFSSFTGSTADNWGFTATYDQQGNMYSGGVVFAAGYPTSPGAFRTSFGGVIDIGIIKYNTTATGAASRLWATYVGGSQADVPHSLVVNNQGDLLILGTTSSNNYPVSGNGYDRSFNLGSNVTPLNGISYAAGSDLVVTRLSGNGANLVGSTYLGGSGNDGLLASTGSFNQVVRNYGDQFRGDITVDASDNVYVASSTNSINFPLVGAVQGSHRGGVFDAVVARLTPTLDNLTFSSYFGGSGLDAAYSIQLNAARDIYVGGGTASADLTPTAGAAQGTLFGGVDGYILRLTPTAGGSYQAQRVTYLGTGQYDQVYFVQLDDLGGVYALGQTRGTWPIVGNVYRNPNGRQFINKLAPDLGSVVLSTAFGTGRTNPDISPTAFLVDQCERIYVCGWGGTTNQGAPYDNENVVGLPVTSTAIQRTTDGNDFYLMQLAPYAATLEYATYFGGTGADHVDGGTSRFDRRGYVYQAVCGGCGGSSSFPIPPGAGSYSTRNNADNCNNAAFKIDFGINAAVAGPNQDICLDAAPMRLVGSPAGGTWTGTGVTGSAQAGYTFTPATAAVGNHVLTYSVASTGTCVTTSTLTMTVKPITPISFALPQQICRDETPLRLTATPAGGTFSGPGVSNGEFSPRAAGPGTHAITYTLPSPLCGVSRQQILVNELPVVVAGRDTALCAFQRQSYQLRGTPVGGTWSGQGCTPSGMFTPPATSGPVMLTYTYRASTGCLNAAQLRVMLVPDNRTNRPLELPVCPLTPRPQEGLPSYTGMAPFTHTFTHDLPYATRYEWDFGDPDSGPANTSTEQYPTHVYAKPGTYRVSFTAYYNGTCQSTTQFAPVYVGDPFIPNIITPNGDKQNDVFEQRLSCLPVTMKVFTRWGNQVYESKDYRNDWGGGTLPDGVYYYHLTDTEGRKAKGWLEIRR
ncbi:PKD domain-containing protein [Hymenobacter gummosus]|uniref:PKD domain-containing protein n=1 Tax=Hymenobacter gummosus TaxID=1776032 RepID=A0A3S0JGU3_9BACT|nr:gliding motility-associated C-terminal domain-containing protein [Hymenobacter gummosus]RTQ49552.1 PKD domain-containing protein [Hymenobacter gummosus]